MKILKLLENKSFDPIVDAINKVANKIGRSSSYSGNCGMFALALATKFSDMNPTLGIMYRDDEHILDIPTLLSAETDIYHVVVYFSGKMYDGDGVTGEDELLRIAKVEYGDDEPGFFDEVDPFDRSVRALINNDTNWTISMQEFIKILNSDK